MSVLAQPGSEMKFLVDKTLGRLGRWLRTMGYDTADYLGEIDRGFLETARTEGRIALTRKREMAGREFRGTLLVLWEDRVEDQIKTLTKKLSLKMEPDSLFTICLGCNAKLVRVEKGEIKTEVPEYVFATQVDFRRCPKCGKIFWPATHRERALEYLKRVLQTGRCR
jgi:uncharacterized protein